MAVDNCSRWFQFFFQSFIILQKSTMKQMNEGTQKVMGGCSYVLLLLSLLNVEAGDESILGDTSLSAAMWMAGLDVAPMDLYDTCVVALTVSGLNLTFSVPAARVLSGTSPYPAGEKDAENDGPIFVPKDAQVTALLAAGKLNIGLKHVEEVKEIVRLSGEGRDHYWNCLVDFGQTQ
ncbi:hypothetical protein FB451DRAFT_1370921 [Mycena latifolia]|nr:hypothetical protein FB451DRAFT_1370921 [Mycena latifolia]